MSTMTDAPTKADIVALLQFARQQEETMVERLTESEKSAVGTKERWSARDYLGNILLWKELQTQKLQAVLRGETPPVWTDSELIHQINDRGFQRFQHSLFSQVVDEAEPVFVAFLSIVESLSEEELTDPQRFPRQEGEALWGETLGNGVWHPCSQIAAFYLHSDRMSAAFELQEKLLEAVRQASLPAENLGVAIYNQACFYATNGRPEQALALLPEALRLRPTLIEWSKHDSDLDQLRADPAFQAIFDDPQLQSLAPVSLLVTPEDLHAQRSDGIVPFVIDVRGSQEYAAGHVQGAFNIPLDQLAQRLSEIPPDRAVITYCNMHHRGESRGERGAAELRRHGIQAQTLDGGFPGWSDHGFSVERG
jgi:rhodanese-related sulfurtransferase